LEDEINEFQEYLGKNDKIDWFESEKNSLAVYDYWSCLNGAESKAIFTTKTIQFI